VRLEKLLELRRAMQKRYAVTSEDVTSNPVAAEPTLEDLFLQKLQKTVLENLDDPNLGAEQLCRAVLLSQSQLYRKLNALTGKPPNAFIRKIRLQRALEMLKTTNMNISEIAYATGFNDPNYFSRSFNKEFGKAPIEMRK
jgi:transcriptional regulator GlxA family with amidase domain